MNIHTFGDTTVFADDFEVPGLGVLAVNAYLVRGEQPVIVDTGLGVTGRDFVATVGSVIDPAEIRWIWLTHPDADHTGGLRALLQAAPAARLVTNFVGAGILSLTESAPMERVYLVNPGQSLDVGDRALHAFRPPLYDSPATMGFFDDKSRNCFSSDCFGAPLGSADLATSDDVRAVPASDVRAAQLLWAGVDSPWIHTVDRGAFLSTVKELRAIPAERILSTHLPPVHHPDDAFYDVLADMPGAAPFVGPDQATLEAMLAAAQ
jgi:glyoxylase-like metal-dependent hydrolase (beta-lactamase superfamily II)